MIHFFQGVFFTQPLPLCHEHHQSLISSGIGAQIAAGAQVSDGAGFRNATVPLAWLPSGSTIALSPLRHLTRTEVFYRQQISQQQSTSLCRAETSHKGNLCAFCKDLDIFVSSRHRSGVPGWKAIQMYLVQFQNHVT